jgi:DNA-3-methyladenine glycosylase
VRDLCRGPARLAQAFGVDRSFDGIDLVAGDDLWVERGGATDASAIRSGPRVGIRAGIDLPWRFWLDEPWVSASRSPAASRR